MQPGQESSNDPCRALQILKERNKQAAPRARSSRPTAEDQFTPTNRHAEKDCVTAVNAFKALPSHYKIECPVIHGSVCTYIDSFYTCSVAIPGKLFGCLPAGTQFVSLRRCAEFVLRRIEKQKRERENEESQMRQEEALSQRVKEVQRYGGGDPQRGVLQGSGGDVQSGSGQGGTVQRPGGRGAAGGPRPGPVIIRENTNVNRGSRSSGSGSWSYIGRDSNDHSGPSNWQNLPHSRSSGSIM